MNNSIVSNLEIPWSISFLPNNHLIVTERIGNIKIFDDKGNLTAEAKLPSVKAIGESGLLGVCIHPNHDPLFKNAIDIKNSENYKDDKNIKDAKDYKSIEEIKLTPFTTYVGEDGKILISPGLMVFFYYTHQSEDGSYWNRVIRTHMIYDPENSAAPLEFKNTVVVVDHIPAAQYHDGGRIKFSPFDGYLYITTGDATQSHLSQDPTSLAGKILRVDINGNPALGNPLGTRIYAIGIRNCQGICFTPTGKIFCGDHGNIARDRLLLLPSPSEIIPGVVPNFGWPITQGAEFDPKRGLMGGIIESGSETWAPSGLAYYKGSLFFGGLRGESLYQAVLSPLENEVIGFYRHFPGKYGRLRDVVVGPERRVPGHKPWIESPILDEILYVTTSNLDGRGEPRSGDDKILMFTL